MKEYKIFKPELMLSDFLKSSWCKNIKTIESRIPISQFLKARGIWALEISPQAFLDWYAFGLPINKDWKPEKFDNDAILSFQIYSEGQFGLDVSFEDQYNKKTSSIPITIKNLGHIDTWDKIEIPIPIRDVRIIFFSGSANTPNYVIKDIVIKS